MFQYIKNKISKVRSYLSYKLSYSTNTVSKEYAIYRLIDKFILYINLSFFLGFLPPCFFYLLKHNNIDLKESLIFSSFFSLAVMFISLVFNFDMIEKVISTEIDAVEQQFPKTTDVLALKKEIKKLEKKINTLEETTDSKVREYLLRLNLVRLDEAAPDLIEQIIINNSALTKSRKTVNSMPIFLSDVKEDYTNWERRKNLGAVIRTIKEDSWKALAKNAAIFALGCNPDGIAYGPDDIVSGKLGNLLFKDIYIYLYAWLVNSIDHSISRDAFYTPIDDIGLHYPSGQSPDIGKYTKAFEFLINTFEHGDFYEFIKDIQSTFPEQSLSIEQIEICKKEVSLYLNKLIEMLDDFERRPRESQSIK